MPEKQTPSRPFKNIILNTALFMAVALIGYGLTFYFDNGKPPSSAVDKSRPIAQDNKPIQPFSFTDISGQVHNIEDFRGKIVIINFWATWCAPCVVEFPALLELAAKNKDDVVLIALSSDMDENAIKVFLRKQAKPTANVYIAHDREDVTLKLFGVTQLPETIIADRDLKKREKLIGAEWLSKDVQKILDSLRINKIDNDILLP
jgi:thiol-disulfide isomerase/thioredoxin